MGKRGPTLFELMGEGARLRGSHANAPPGSPAEPAEESPDYPGTPTTLRIPRGYLFIAGAGVLAAMFLAYSIGFQSGKKRQDRLEAHRLAVQTARRTDSPTRDPLLEPVVKVNPYLAPTTKHADADPASTPALRAGRGATSGDPRVPGLNYFVVAYYPEGLAGRAAAFLRAHGVDAAVVSADTSPGKFYVISLTGFPASQVGSPAYAEHRSALMRLGRLWKRENGGPDDFSSIWAQKYQPRPAQGGARASVPDD